MIRLVLFLSLLLQFSALADMVIVQKIEGAGQLTEMTLKFKDTKVRADISPQITTISDISTGDVTTIMHAQKSYMSIPASTSKTLMDQVQKQVQKEAGDGSPAPVPTLQPTGRKEKINGYDTEEYTSTIGGTKVSYWIAPNFPNWPAVLAAMLKFRQGGMSAMTKGWTPEPSSFPGMPIRTVMENNGQKVATTLVSVKEQPLDAGEFRIPAGYTQMQMPSFNRPQH